MVTGYDHLLFLFGVIFFTKCAISGCTSACLLSDTPQRCSLGRSLTSA
jgi:hypothetical protein